MQEMEQTQVQPLGQEDPLEKGMANHSSIPAWRIPWTEEPGRLQVHSITKSQTLLKWLSMHAILSQLPFQGASVPWNFNFMVIVTILSDSDPKKRNSVTSSILFPICQEVMGPDAIILVFWMLSFKPAFSLSCFTFIKRFFSSFSLSATKVVSSVYQRLLICLLVILIPACDSSSPAFHKMYSAYKLKKQGDK